MNHKDTTTYKLLNVNKQAQFTAYLANAYNLKIIFHIFIYLNPLLWIILLWI